MFNCLNNEQENSNMNLLIQKTFRETVQKSLKELKITNQKNNRGQQSRAEEDPNHMVQPNQTYVFLNSKDKAYVNMVKIASPHMK